MSPRRRCDQDFLRCRRIQVVVGRYYGVTAAEIRSSRTPKMLTRARTMAIGIAREVGRWSYPDLAAMFERTNHTTMISADRRFRALLEVGHGDALELLELVRADPDCCPPSPSPLPVNDRFVDELVAAGVRRPAAALHGSARRSATAPPPAEPVERVVPVPSENGEKVQPPTRKPSRRVRRRSPNNVIPIDRDRD